MIGGRPITKKKEGIPENQSYVCPNPSCGRVFNSPIKAENLSTKKVEVYDACPFCLTEITVEKSSMAVEEEKHLKRDKPESEKVGTNSEEKMSIDSPPKAKGCAHHFGYLSKRSSKEKIPDECMICENIVQCMLKNVTT
jgi:hypothetical protein